MTIYHIAPKRSGHAFVGNMVRSWTDARYVDRENMRPHQFIRPAGDYIILLQTRDLLNWFASYYTSVKRVHMKMIESWLCITSEFYRERYLKGCNVVRVMYDHFCESQKYRINICGQLYGTYNEHELQHVPHNGGGSSFTGTRYNGKAKEMPTLDRYRQVDSAIYKRLFQKRPDLLKFYKRYMATAEKLEFVRGL